LPRTTSANDLDGQMLGPRPCADDRPSEEEGLKSNQSESTSTAAAFVDGEKGEVGGLRDERPPALEDSPVADPS
jgi:hypothetical protein